MLLEVLVAILIFAIGVLSLVGLQVASIKESGKAKYRTDATLLANELIGRMWVTDRSFANLSAQFESAGPGAAYTAWLPAVQAALPGVAANPPVVTVVVGPGRWRRRHAQQPGDGDALVEGSHRAGRRPAQQPDGCDPHQVGAAA